MLKHGWWALLSAMSVSVGAGFVLKNSLALFPSIAIFQPVINGLLLLPLLFIFQEWEAISWRCRRVESAPSCTNPPRKTPRPFALLSPSAIHAEPSVLMVSLLLEIKGIRRRLDDSTNSLAHLLAGASPLPRPSPSHQKSLNHGLGCPSLHDRRRLAGISKRLTLSLEVGTLLFLCQFLVRLLWKIGVDPDDAAMPLLTSVGDFLGAGLLSLAFRLASLHSQPFQAQ